MGGALSFVKNNEGGCQQSQVGLKQCVWWKHNDKTQEDVAEEARKSSEGLEQKVELRLSSKMAHQW